MQGCSALSCSSNTVSSPVGICCTQRLTLPFRNQSNGFLENLSSFPAQSRFKIFHFHQSTLPLLHCTATEEILEASETDGLFVETGYIYSVHGLQGEVRVKATTDFPELRFSKPGRRWLRQQVSGRDMVQEIELMEGRGHPGQKSWILKFHEIDSIEEAQKLVGSALLVKDEDRPVLEEGEFYTRDLVGMRVFLKETRELVGTVINVFDSGASDLLHVELLPDRNAKPRLEGGASGPLVWVPFVEAIVPNVDLSKREMLITPPKGLLELNIRADERSKKERRQLEWKERKKFQKRLIAAKKILHEMEQDHIFHGFRFGEKNQKSFLANQIVDVNSTLLQHALQNKKIPYKRWSFPDFVNALQVNNTLKLSKEFFSKDNAEHSSIGSKVQEQGHCLISSGKVAIVLALGERNLLRTSSIPEPAGSHNNEDIAYLHVKALLDNSHRLLKMEDRPSLPLILVCSAESIEYLKQLFMDHDYFSFDSKKVWFLEEEKLPVVSAPQEEENKHKILMKSPWEILQRPAGSAGIVTLLSSQNLVEHLHVMGVEYIQVCSSNQEFINGEMLLGFTNSREANAGIQVFGNAGYLEEHFNIVFSIEFAKKLTKKTDKLQFEAILKPNQYVEMVEKEWVDVIPSSPNSYEFHSSIYSCLNACPPSKVCLVDITA
ncbi:uncharacterized protein LOC132043085 isoform X1 [Lycium ferocissimum]|uniref:uncharacterized protein LOC132043085 isoform X1 n=2 Tax=Lycium ferocissimum TaxID=112874 RepID=UPI002815CD82|nr:uncharacterized protein LOC132043085 isoform X1 [Lycium ferocissimum]XP_059289567.1 uncharacterized protein LOC132043085 isoform X1 [Lycium ferocissimum]